MIRRLAPGGHATALVTFHLLEPGGTTVGIGESDAVSSSEASVMIGKPTRNETRISVGRIPYLVALVLLIAGGAVLMVPTVRWRPARLGGGRR